MESHQYREQLQVPKESSRIIHVFYLIYKSIFGLRHFPFAASTSSQQLRRGSALPSQIPQHMHTQHQTTDGRGHLAFFGLKKESESPQQWTIRLFSRLFHPVLHLKEEVPTGAKPASLSPFLTTPKSNLPKSRCPAQLISIKNRIYHCHLQDSLCCSYWRP